MYPLWGVLPSNAKICNPLRKSNLNYLIIYLNRDAISTALSALYAKLIVVLGIALPVTDILSVRGPASFYQGFYLYLYLVSVAFVAYMYVAHVRSRTLFTLLDTFSKLSFLATFHIITLKNLSRFLLSQTKRLEMVSTDWE